MDGLFARCATGAAALPFVGREAATPDLVPAIRFGSTGFARVKAQEQPRCKLVIERAKIKPDN